MRPDVFAVFVSIALIPACVEHGAASIAQSSEQDLTSSCTGSFTKLSDLTLVAPPPHDSYTKRQLVDFDGDGHIDLVTIPRGVLDDATKPWGKATFHLLVDLGDGSGKLAPPIVSELHAHADATFTFADFDGNGLLDVLYQSDADGYQQVLRHADGSWGAPSPVDIQSSCAFTRTGEIPYETSRSVGDTNGDGKADVHVSLVSADASGAEHGDIVLNGTSAGLGSASCQKFSTADVFGEQWFAMMHTKVADIDGDGKVDLVGYSGSRQLKYALDFHSTKPKVGEVGWTHNNTSYEAVVGRFDLDAIDDVADLTGYGVSLAYGDAKTPLERRVQFYGLPSIISESNNGTSMAGDFNGDGRTDFVFYSSQVTPVSGARLTPMVCSLPSGEHQRFETTVPLDDARVDLLGAADLNGDGRSELVMLVVESGSAHTPARLVVLEK